MSGLPACKYFFSIPVTSVDRIEFTVIGCDIGLRGERKSGVYGNKHCSFFISVNRRIALCSVKNSPPMQVCVAES